MTEDSAIGPAAWGLDIHPSNPTFERPPTWRLASLGGVVQRHILGRGVVCNLSRTKSSRGVVFDETGRTTACVLSESSSYSRRDEYRLFCRRLAEGGAQDASLLPPIRYGAPSGPPPSAASFSGHASVDADGTTPTVYAMQVGLHFTQLVHLARFAQESSSRRIGFEHAGGDAAVPPGVSRLAVPAHENVWTFLRISSGVNQGRYLCLGRFAVQEYDGETLLLRPLPDTPAAWNLSSEQKTACLASGRVRNMHTMVDAFGPGDPPLVQQHQIEKTVRSWDTLQTRDTQCKRRRVVGRPHRLSSASDERRPARPIVFEQEICEVDSDSGGES